MRITYSYPTMDLFSEKDLGVDIQVVHELLENCHEALFRHNGRGFRLDYVIGYPYKTARHFDKITSMTVGSGIPVWYVERGYIDYEEVAGWVVTASEGTAYHYYKEYQKDMSHYHDQEGYRHMNEEHVAYELRTIERREEAHPTKSFLRLL